MEPKQWALLGLVACWALVFAAAHFLVVRKREREVNRMVAKDEPKESGVITRHVFVDSDNDEVSAEVRNDFVILGMARPRKKSKVLELAVRLNFDEAEEFAKTILGMVEKGREEESVADDS